MSIDLNFGTGASVEMDDLSHCFSHNLPITDRLPCALAFVRDQQAHDQ